MGVAKRLFRSLKQFAQDLRADKLEKYRITKFRRDENGNLVRYVQEPKKE